MDAVTAVFSLAISLGIYFLPALIAKARNHHQRVAILILNLFLGWTILGWIISLVWACTAVIEKSNQPRAT